MKKHVLISPLTILFSHSLESSPDTPPSNDNILICEQTYSWIIQKDFTTMQKRICDHLSELSDLIIIKQDLCNSILFLIYDTRKAIFSVIFSRADDERNVFH